MSVTGLAAAAVRAPWTGRARRDILFCVLGLPLSFPLPVIGFVVTIRLAQASGPPWTADGNPSSLAVLAAAAVVALVAVLMVTTGTTRTLAAASRHAAGSLVGEQVAAPPPPRPRRGLAERLRDGPGWRAMAYLMLKLPAGMLEWYAVAIFWGAGLVNLTYPFWWQSFRNHSPGVRLNPVTVITPFDWFGQGHFRVATFPGTFAAFGAGSAMLLAAPWVTRGIVAADRWLIRGLLGPGRLTQRLADLEQTRALAVEDAAARLRRLERDLHDGLADALASLAATSAIPAELAVSVPVRPTPAIETIAYFCAAELLANAAKHSQASTIKIFLTERAGLLALQITDDGLGGADASG